MSSFIDTLTEKVLDKRAISFDEAMYLYKQDNLFDLFDSATKIRSFFKSDFIKLCSIINAKSGNCCEDCIFCAQSAHHNSDVESFSLRSKKDILEAASFAKKKGAHEFSIVISGRGLEDESELETICQTIKEMALCLNMIRCASLGMLSKEYFKRLKDSGLDYYHHNLETSKNFFPKICTTHTYDDKYNNIKKAKEAGLKICSGAIFGIGEGIEDRVDLAFALKELDIDSVPLNFLHPIKGTPAGNLAPMMPTEILRTIVVYRFILPDKDIRICGGREYNLRGFQPFIFASGANGILLGDYLTTKGQSPLLDLEMIKNMGLRYDEG